jgi:hypothetical protein
MTTSQCSKSQPSRRIVSLGGRLLQLGDESRSEDVAGWVAKHRTTAPGADAPAPAGRRLADAASGRRRVGARRPAWSARERRSARERDADAIAEARAKPLEGDEMAEIREEAAAVAIIRV